MLSIGRSTSAVEHLTPSGRRVRLVGEVWWVIAANRRGAAVLGYQRPRRVEVDDERARIVDYTGLARLAALVVLGCLFSRRFTS